jgi:hypothetical protein
MGDNKDAPDYVYYNADIINNTTANTIENKAVYDPQIRFNETRDSAIIQNAADYFFSIVRFTMNGPNKDLPLFIPQIKEGTGQINENLTVYSMAVPITQAFVTSTGPITLTVQPRARFIQYESETQNPVLAPTPSSMANALFLGQYSTTKAYQIDQIVSLTPIDPLYKSYLEGPFYAVIPPPIFNYTQLYAVGSAVSYQTQFYYASVEIQAGVIPGVSGSGWVLGTPVVTSPLYATPNNSRYWTLLTKDEGDTQDLSSRYYWVYTYQRWVDLWNLTMYDPTQVGSGPSDPSTCVYQDTYVALYQAWIANPGFNTYTFPYATFGDFCNLSGYPPQMTYDSTGKFTIYGDSASFGPFPLKTFTPSTPSGTTVGLASPPRTQLFFNSNMFGLFCNYANIYRNTDAYPDGYVTEILFVNKFYKNILDTTVVPYTNYDPQTQGPIFSGRMYWLAEQDYTSTDSLWSPIASIVFTSSLLPVKSEATGAPVVLGNGNNGFSAPITQAAFQPIITDIALNTGTSGGAADYRQFIYYTPSAEYRLSDFASSKQDIRNVDIQVFWKNRLDNQLYPINMYNLSSVSLKIMFKHK